MPDGQATDTFQVINALGVHARVASMLVLCANRYKSEIRLQREGEDGDAPEVNGKSIMGVLMLAAPKGSVIRVRTIGDDAAEALKAIGELFKQGFYEGVGKPGGGV